MATELADGDRARTWRAYASTMGSRIGSTTCGCCAWSRRCVRCGRVQEDSAAGGGAKEDTSQPLGRRGAAGRVCGTLLWAVPVGAGEGARAKPAAVAATGSCGERGGHAAAGGEAGS